MPSHPISSSLIHKREKYFKSPQNAGLQDFEAGLQKYVLLSLPVVLMYILSFLY